VIVGRLIPAGTGLAFHDERRRKRKGMSIEQEIAQEMAAVNSENDQAATQAEQAGQTPDES
jgi:DNA-directed RNA polymerase subunit beta'